MDNIEDQSIDDILKSIRASIVDSERKKYFQTFIPESDGKSEVYELSKNMLVKRVDIPYWVGVWNFNDVAQKIMKKYNNYFSNRHIDIGERVRVKGNERL